MTGDLEGSKFRTVNLKLHAHPLRVTQEKSFNPNITSVSIATQVTFHNIQTNRGRGARSEVGGLNTNV